MRVSCRFAVFAGPLIASCFAEGVFAQGGTHAVWLHGNRVSCEVSVATAPAPPAAVALGTAGGLSGACDLAAKAVQCKLFDAKSLDRCTRAGHPLIELALPAVRLYQGSRHETRAGEAPLLILPKDLAPHGAVEFPAAVTAGDPRDLPHEPLCGGTLLGPGLVLTAAHCLDLEPKPQWWCANHGALVGQSGTCTPAPRWGNREPHDRRFDFATCSVTGLEKCTTDFAVPAMQPGSPLVVLGFSNLTGVTGAAAGVDMDSTCGPPPARGVLRQGDAGAKIQRGDSGFGVYLPASPPGGSHRMLAGVVSEWTGEYVDATCAEFQATVKSLAGPRKGAP